MKKLFLIMSVSALLGACAGNDMPVAQLPEIDTNNPLLAEWETPHATPPFDKISISDYEPAFETAIAVSRAEIDAIVNNPAKPSFNNTILALEKQGELLDRISSVFFNLLECHTSPEMQEIAMRVQPKLTELGNDVSLNPAQQPSLFLVILFFLFLVNLHKFNIKYKCRVSRKVLAHWSSTVTEVERYPQGNFTTFSYQLHTLCPACNHSV